MNEATKRLVDVAFGTVTVLIAIFGLWRYFHGVELDRAAAAQARTLDLIGRHGEAEMLAVESHLFEFWRGQPAFVALIRDLDVMGETDYANFVSVLFETGSLPDETRVALLRLSRFFDEVHFCKASAVCDEDLLDAYFCSIAPTLARAYGPFFEEVNREIASSASGASLVTYSRACDA